MKLNEPKHTLMRVAWFNLHGNGIAYLAVIWHQTFFEIYLFIP
jgi:hypothetical protein